MQNQAMDLASRTETPSQAVVQIPQTPRASYVSPGHPSKASGTSGKAGHEAPGWYADPIGSHEHRYRDGSGWTRHVADAGIMGIDLSTSPFVLFAPGGDS